MHHTAADIVYCPPLGIDKGLPVLVSGFKTLLQIARDQPRRYQTLLNIDRKSQAHFATRLYLESMWGPLGNGVWAFL